MELTRDDFLRWHELLEAMMRQYCPGRERLYDLCLDLIGFMAKGSRLRALDLGCSSGSFAGRLIERFPHATVCAIDRSAKELYVGKTLLGADRVTWVKSDLPDPGWTADIPEGSADVAFTGWTTHEIESWRLDQLY